ncbi:MAG: AI-2E family transporter [Magnetococcus sp. WYHC-3]
MASHQDSLARRLALRFTHPQVVALLVVTLTVFVIISWFGKALAPYLTAAAFTFFLDDLVLVLNRMKIPRPVAVLLVFGLFLLSLIIIFIVLIPMMVQQLKSLLAEIPRLTVMLKEQLRLLAESASGVINREIIENMLVRGMESAQDFMADVATYLVFGVPGIITVLVYVVLVPFLVFFFLLDKRSLMETYITRFIPRERHLIDSVLADANRGIGGYMRGKIWETLILGILSYFTFFFMDLRFAPLLGILTGLSVLIPFIGLAVVAVPVVIAGLVQFGPTFDGVLPLIAYAVVQLVDANILQPIILGETVKVHPTTIILAALFFGSLWGILGVFVAIPLAVVVRSLVNAILAVDTSATET